MLSSCRWNDDDYDDYYRRQWKTLKIQNQDFVMEEETPHGVFEDAGLG